MGCNNLVCANKNLIHLNAIVLSNLNLLTLSLISPLVCRSDHIQNPIFCALIAPRFIHCFINSTFVLKYNILTKPTPPVKLKLFNGLSSNTITKTTFLPIIFPSRDQMILNVYVIPLDSFCFLVLGYMWLIQHNPTINWDTGFITFWLDL